MVYEGHVLLETVTWWDIETGTFLRAAWSTSANGGWLNVCLSLMLEAFPDPVAVTCIACYGDKILCTITPVSKRASREAAAAAADSVWFENQ